MKALHSASLSSLVWMSRFQIHAARWTKEFHVSCCVLKSKKREYHPKFPLEREVALVNGVLVEVFDPGDCSLRSEDHTLTTLSMYCPSKVVCAQDGRRTHTIGKEPRCYKE